MTLSSLAARAISICHTTEKLKRMQNPLRQQRDDQPAIGASETHRPLRPRPTQYCPMDADEPLTTIPTSFMWLWRKIALSDRPFPSNPQTPQKALTNGI
jgi:hypothetical protein